MKKKFLLLILCLMGVAYIFLHDEIEKIYIANYVKTNFRNLEKYAENILLYGENSSETIYEKWRVSGWADHNKVEFIVRSHGIAPTGTYEGFYFSPDDKPIGFQGAKVNFVKESAGWKWEEVGGDNWEYTEKIIDKWYWFKVSF